MTNISRRKQKRANPLGKAATKKAKSSEQALKLGWVLFAAFMSGACVMVVEIVGTRVLTPFFGVGLYVWSALLVVTLGSLALGYYIGGHLADKKSKVNLPAQLILSGMWVAITPLLRSPLLLALDGSDLRIGATIAAALLFGPALCLMGMVSTTAVKLSIQSTQRSGRATGRVYAISTMGSLVGTLATGFWLVPSFPVGAILWGTALLLIASGLSGLAVSRNLPLVGLAALALTLSPIVDCTETDAQVKILKRSQSLYSNLAVVQDNSRDTPLMLLKADHSFIGGQWQTGDPAFGFVHILGAGRFARPQAKRALIIGLGIGSSAAALVKAGLTVDIVELDPGVVQLAKDYFGFHTNGDVFVEDARTFIHHLDRKYDLIIHDTFTGGATPEHLLSLEVMQQLSQLLTVDGILTLNMVGATSGPLAPATWAVQRTLSEEFSVVRAFQDGPPEEEGDIHNILFFAASSVIEFDESLIKRTRNAAMRAKLSQFSDWEVLKTTQNGQLITDDHNPIAHLSTPVSVAFHRQIAQLYPAEFWVN